MKMSRRVLSVLAVGVALSSTVLAHMALSKSLPAKDAVVASTPAKVQLWFSQAPDVAVSKLTLTGPSGAVKLGALAADADKSMSAAVEADTPDGAYTVAWQAAGDDGHLQKGEFAFSVRRTR
ncbi:MAG TPA: copper resistance CopC family protein [Vicinamibacterales bacterium]|nr:copper resistance CopC family protein [Vicinamibacterales bacterium]